MVLITLNGIKQELKADTTIADLLKGMELPKYFVVEKNLNIIYKENYETQILKDGDSVEVAAFCGGG